MKCLALHPVKNPLTSSIKILYLTLHGQKFLNVFKYMIEDIVDSTIHGIQSYAQVENQKLYSSMLLVLFMIIRLNLQVSMLVHIWIYAL